MPSPVVSILRKTFLSSKQPFQTGSVFPFADEIIERHWRRQDLNPCCLSMRQLKSSLFVCKQREEQNEDYSTGQGCLESQWGGGHTSSGSHPNYDQERTSGKWPEITYLVDHWHGDVTQWERKEEGSEKKDKHMPCIKRVTNDLGCLSIENQVLLHQRGKFKVGR